MEQERYLGIDGAVKTIRLHGYNAVHSADLVVNERLSVGTVRNINDRFTHMADKDGFATQIVLCYAPQHVADPDGDEINMLTRACNRSLGIYNRTVYCPKPFRTDKEIADAIYATFNDRELHLTLPTRDGYEGAAFDIIDAARDVLRQAELDNNLRALAHGRKRRLQVVFDKLRWSSGLSMTRWNLRTPDTVRDHNSTRYGRDMMNYQGDDSLTLAWLTKSVRSHRFGTTFSCVRYLRFTPLSPRPPQPPDIRDPAPSGTFPGPSPFVPRPRGAGKTRWGAVY